MRGLIRERELCRVEGQGIAGLEAGELVRGQHAQTIDDNTSLTAEETVEVMLGTRR